MDTRETMQASGYGSIAVNDAGINQSDDMENMENCTATTSGSHIKLNELAAGALCKTVDTAAAITQFAVNIPIGIGLVTLGSVSKWVADGTEGISTQFNALVNRVFKVKG